MSEKKFVKAGPVTLKIEDNALDNRLEELILAIENCLGANLFMPALILIYSGIDILSNLSRPASKEYGDRTDFCDWCDKYLLPNTKDIFANSKDIYAARCAIVHTYGYKALLIDRGKANKMFYTFKGKTAEEFKEKMKYSPHRNNSSFVNINSFADGFKKGIEAFFNDIKNESDRQKLVEQRAVAFYSILTPL